MTPKALLLSLSALLTLSWSPAQQIQVVDILSNDLVYDPHTDRIFISIPSANGANGNRVGIINPHTAQLDTSIFIGSEPGKLAISDDGQYLYVGLDGAASVRRFDIPTRKAGLQFPLGSDPFTGLFYVEDMAVMPGHAHTIAVSRRNEGFSPRHEGVAIYDDGVIRQNVTQDHTGSNVIEFIAPNALIGYNNETTEFGLRRLMVNNAGVVEATVYANYISGFFADILYSEGNIYSTNGRVINVSGNPPLLSGTFPNTFGRPVADTFTQRIAYVQWQSPNGAGTRITLFDPGTFLAADEIQLPQIATGQVYAAVCWGPCRYAFNTQEGQLVIVDGCVSGADDLAGEMDIRVFPNPAADQAFVHNPTQAETTVRIYSMEGRQVGAVTSTDAVIALDLTACSSRLLVLEIQQAERVVVRKLVRQY